MTTHDAEHFKQSYQTGQTPWDIGKPDFNLIQTVSSTPIEPCKTLEIGCGTGDNAIWMAEQGFDVVAVDASPIAIEQAKNKAANAGAKCDFAVLDVFQGHIQEAPFHFAFDRGFFHTIDAPEMRKSFAETVGGLLDDDGLWLSLSGNADEKRGDRPGPPQLSARDIVTAVEPLFEILSLVSSHFEAKLPHAPRNWVCLMRKR